MKLWVNRKLINNKYENLIIKGKYDENCYLQISSNTEAKLKSKKIKIFINHIGGDKIIESFKCVIDAEEGNYRINVGGGEPCSCMISTGVKGNFSANIYRGSKVFIGVNTTSNGCEIFCDNSFFSTGIDCMISNEVIFQTSDQHSIINLDDGNIVNNLKVWGGMNIENHVWVGRRSTLVGHLNVKSGSVIGIGFVLASDVPSHTVFAGNPAREIRNNVTWCRHPHRFEEYVQKNLNI